MRHGLRLFLFLFFFFKQTAMDPKVAERATSAKSYFLRYFAFQQSKTKGLNFAGLDPHFARFFLIYLEFFVSRSYLAQQFS